jgi:hypothetical protein
VQAEETSARGLVEDYKLRSSQTRDQSDRAWFAEVTSSFAVASDSPDVLHKTLIWVWRHNRDPLTVSRLYLGSLLVEDDVITLLSGLAARITADLEHS